ncbi:hypothetical protein C8239_13105 [Paracidovorax avenae]|nr:hypothetical protein C8239_13105 [Paracidovorax avenae]
MPPGHTEHATPPAEPISTVAEPWTIGPPFCVMSPCRAAGLPLIWMFLSWMVAAGLPPKVGDASDDPARWASSNGRVFVSACKHACCGIIGPCLPAPRIPRVLPALPPWRRPPCPMR